jgi:hypothetical protein
MTHLTRVEVAVALSSVEHPTWVKNRETNDKPTLSNLCRNFLNLLDSAILPVSISPIISKGMLNVGCRYKTGI